jgi:uncharacterized membrane protein
MVVGCAEHEAQGKPTGAECDPSLRYQDDVAPLIEHYCLPCHSQKLPLRERRGAPADHNFDTEPDLIAEAEHVELAAAGGPLAINRSMPPSSAPQPNDAERRLLGQWLACLDHGGHVH